MKLVTFKLAIMFWLLLLPGDAEEKNDLRHVYVQKGGVAKLHVKTKNSLNYARIGSPKEQEMNTKVLYIRVAMENSSLTIVRGVMSNIFGKLTFHGNLSHGAFFTLSNVTMKDNATIIRILYQELGKGAEKQDFLIIIVEAITSSLSPSVVTNRSSGNTSDHPAVHRTNTTETRNDTDPRNDTDLAKSIPSPEPSTSLNILLVIPACIVVAAVRLILLLIVSVRKCMKRKNKNWEEHQPNEWDPPPMDWFEMGGRYQPGVQEEV